MTSANVRQIVIDIISDIAPDEDVTNLDDKVSQYEERIDILNKDIENIKNENYD